MPPFNSVERTCETCGGHFLAQPNEIRRGSGRYCSVLCARQARMNTEADFWSKVIKTDGCWTWNGTIHGNGYGGISFRGKFWPAHRLAYVLTNGPIADCLKVCHRCDTPLCVNPAHLFLGTTGDNNRDKHAKGRAPAPPTRTNPDCAARGERVSTAKLTATTVAAIRSALADGESGAALGRRYGVQRAAINRIRRGETWRHVPAG